MAGGAGTRFWPLSRQKIPKQLLNLTGKDLMINEAVDRLINVAGKGNVFIVTNVTQVPPMIEATRGRVLPEHILSEPAARNTAACIGYAAMEIIKKHGDGVMVITPSDHYIKNIPAFTRILNLAVKTAAETDKLITIGITPTVPSTGFGYIKFGSGESEVKPVLAFKEKPDEETAKTYIDSGVYAWNSGMFVWKASVILAKFKELIPDIYEDLEKMGSAMNTDAEKETIETIYPNIRKISVDYAIMEPSSFKGDVLVIPGEFGWDDVGSLDMMEVLHQTDENGNVQIGDTLAIDTSNTVLYSSKKIVTAVGVDNLVIVETSDAIMVCRKDKAQDVKKIVDALNIAEKREIL
ncbi:mannose-1-phosphate guanylyltransferase [Clostridia bacterium]|nr:mannose-1-phosphate guanylyltransferase [Clostridia bacterium]